ncbi:hypothetical protein [Embleya scabrispora]|nr:hypothetical protein [Embleya scabrispora]
MRSSGRVVGRAIDDRTDGARELASVVGELPKYAQTRVTDYEEYVG